MLSTLCQKSEMQWKCLSFAVLTLCWIFTHLNTAFAQINFVDNPSQRKSNGNQLIYRGNNKVEKNDKKFFEIPALSSTKSSTGKT